IQTVNFHFCRISKSVLAEILALVSNLTWDFLHYFDYSTDFHYRR
ncbi:unnamed protein product, partial [Tenebrio molitor]